MSVTIVCLSKEHGNTRKIAEVMADALGTHVLTPAQVTADTIAASTLVGFGSGIRYARHYEELFALVESLPKQQGTKAFIFSTSGFGLRSWHWSLRRRLEAHGFDVVAEFCCRGLDTMGPLRLLGGVNKARPNTHDLILARAFAHDLPQGVADTASTS